jgi:UDP-N-acetylmuramoyl-tripeptide--D-alanyl-D-alanine ligase
VVEDPGRVPPGTFALVVCNAERALFDLGGLIRSRSLATFVAITGSAGKTTAKEFTAALLSARGPVLATQGNLNNHLGVPLTLARLEDGHWAAVIECGMSRAGEISRLVHLIRPRVAAVTNVAEAHLEFFASLDDIAAAKSEIFETMGPGDVALAPANEPRLAKSARATAALARLFGEGTDSSIRAESPSMSIEGSVFELHIADTRVQISLSVPGAHAISNFLVAAGIASALGLSTAAIVSGALRLRAGDNRGAVRRLQDDILLIDDTYNSNPRALRSAIDTLSLARDRRRVACIGDMLELGPEGPRLHREVGAALGSRIDVLLGVGSLASEIAAGASSLPPEAKKLFATSVDLASNIASLVQRHDAVLVKGSRGMRMERVVEALIAAHPGVPA